ncbi:unnamed protein product [Cladocopium goreaui]|uniref:Uncharacterized protein n=1 Tax=Cladocopium goreaui TaxID=2562237 RepID=A0A9P1CSF7_9DINO|nr:unnamed protein product [Cladocopium goreaui]
MEKTNRAINRGGFVGDLILTCNEGLPFRVAARLLRQTSAPVKLHAGKLVRDASSTVAVSFASAPHSVTSTAQILHGETGSVGCSTADSGFTGDIVLSCTNGVLSQSSESCAERACEQDLAYELHLFGQSSSRTLASEVQHSGTFTVLCSDVNEAYDHDITAGMLTMLVISGR